MLGTVLARPDADAAPKLGAERAQTGEADLEAELGDARCVLRQQPLGPLQA